MNPYLYAITDDPEGPLPGEFGLEDAPLISFPYRDIAAVTSPLTTAGVSSTEANLWRHEVVVEALMRDRTLLPVRFGTVLTDEATTYNILAAHYADFVTSLDRVRGRAELGLRVLWESDPRLLINDSRPMSGEDLPPTPLTCDLPLGSGRFYLLERLAEERQRRGARQRAEALAMELHTPLTRLAVESTGQVLVTPRLLLTAAYLVEHDRVAAFRQEVRALIAAYPTLHFLSTGPWPAYSFVTGTVPVGAGDGGPAVAHVPVSVSDWLSSVGSWL